MKVSEALQLPPADSTLKLEEIRADAGFRTTICTADKLPAQIEYNGRLFSVPAVYECGDFRLAAFLLGPCNLDLCYRQRVMAAAQNDPSLMIDGVPAPFFQEIGARLPAGKKREQAPGAVQLHSLAPGGLDNYQSRIAELEAQVAAAAREREQMQQMLEHREALLARDVGLPGEEPALLPAGWESFSKAEMSQLAERLGVDAAGKSKDELKAALAGLRE